MFIIVVGRFMAVYLSYYMCTCSKKRDSISKLSFKQLTFISYAALIRGAIAFGLILQIDDDLGDQFQNREIL